MRVCGCSLCREREKREAIAGFADLTERFLDVVEPIREELEQVTSDVNAMSSVNIGDLMDAHRTPYDWEVEGDV